MSNLYMLKGAHTRLGLTCGNNEFNTHKWHRRVDTCIKYLLFIRHSL